MFLLRQQLRTRQLSNTILAFSRTDACGLSGPYGCLRLVRTMLKAGYLEDWEYHETRPTGDRNDRQRG